MQDIYDQGLSSYGDRIAGSNAFKAALYDWKEFLNNIKINKIFKWLLFPRIKKKLEFWSIKGKVFIFNTNHNL